MGIAPYKTFTFDGVSSANYGVYLTGEGVFNAPERDVEMIEIHGRNGAYAFDNGRFKNISVTYKVGMFDVNESNFATKISNFRNWLCSKVGYVRLSDEYNPNEYRMAVYSGGLEVSHEFLIAGEAEITFECKPQRWLTSGETAVTLTSGNDITNPTLFASSPLLQLTGYGNLVMGNDTISVVMGSVIGKIIIANNAATQYSMTTSVAFDDEFLNNGDSITFEDFDEYNFGGAYSCYWEVDSGSISNASASFSGVGGTYRKSISVSKYLQNIVLFSENAVAFNYGTSATKSTTGTISIVTSAYGTVSGTITISMAYNGANTITMTATETLPSHFTKKTSEPYAYYTSIYAVYGDSTKSTTTGAIYIDLDIGECYKVENGSVVSVNNAVVLPSRLPTLQSGNTTITFDNTFNKVEIVPRWWKV